MGLEFAKQGFMFITYLHFQRGEMMSSTEEISFAKIYYNCIKGNLRSKKKLSSNERA